MSGDGLKKAPATRVCLFVLSDRREKSDLSVYPLSAARTGVLPSRALRSEKAPHQRRNERQHRHRKVSQTTSPLASTTLEPMRDTHQYSRNSKLARGGQSLSGSGQIMNGRQAHHRNDRNQ